MRPLRLDGAMGTELIARGLRVPADCPEAWNVDRPAEVRAIHAAYAAAGAEVVQTNTFGALRPRLARFGRADDIAKLIRAAVTLAREAAPGCAVVGSLGPTGQDLPLAGGAGAFGAVEAAYAESAAALAEAGADAIHLETQYHPLELEAAARGIRAGAPRLPLITSITLIPGSSGLETVTGVPLARMVRAIEAAQPDAAGVNCSIDAVRMRAAVEQLRAALALPLWARPQAKVNEKCAAPRSSETVEAFVKAAVALAHAGASAVGGCCGIGPAHIAALAPALSRDSGGENAKRPEEHPAEMEV